MNNGLPFGGKEDYIEINKEGDVRMKNSYLNISFRPLMKLAELLKTPPRKEWYVVIWDSDGDFLITNAKYKKVLPDLFRRLKREE